MGSINVKVSTTYTSSVPSSLTFGICHLPNLYNFSTIMINCFLEHFFSSPLVLPTMRYTLRMPELNSKFWRIISSVAVAVAVSRLQLQLAFDYSQSGF
jgi:hypothetical protein